MRQKRLFVAVFVISISAGTLIVTFPSLVLIPLAQFLVVRDEPIVSDAIVVLLGESGRERTDTAHSLFDKAYAPLIVFPHSYRRTPLGWWGDASQFPIEDGGADYRARLLQAGVPESALRIFRNDDIHDTATELEAVAAYLRQQNVRSVILVSSASHSKRVSIIWRRVAPDISFRAIGAPDPRFDEWWRSGRRRRFVLYEYGALLKELLRRVKGSLRDVF